MNDYELSESTVKNRTLIKYDIRVKRMPERKIKNGFYVSRQRSNFFTYQYCLADELFELKNKKNSRLLLTVPTKKKISYANESHILSVVRLEAKILSLTSFSYPTRGDMQEVFYQTCFHVNSPMTFVNAIRGVFFEK